MHKTVVSALSLFEIFQHPWAVFNFEDYGTNSFCKNKMKNYKNNVMQSSQKNKNLFLDCFSVIILINSLLFEK